MSSKAPQFGETRSGYTYDQNAGHLGGDPNAAARAQKEAWGQGQIGAREGLQGQNQQTGVAAQLAGYAGQAAGRVAPTAQGATTMGAQAGYGNGAQQGVQGQLGLAQTLADSANAPMGPSAAQAQLQQGTNQALDTQLALARSGSGAGDSAAAMDQARFNSAGILAGQANSAAALRAQEDADFRNRQLAARSAAGNLYGQAGGLASQQAQFNAGLAQQTGMFNAQQAQQNSQFNAGAQLQQTGLNDAAALGGYGAASNAYGIGAANALAGNAQALQGQQLGLSALGMETNAQQGLLGLEGNTYNAELSHQLGMRKADQDNANNYVNATSGAIEGLAPLAMMAFSDIRGKRNIRPASYAHVFEALG